MINNTVLVGRLTKDPELRKTQSNISVVRFTLAVNRTFRDESGETQTDFISCIAWRGQAENLAKYMRKGSLVGIEGRIQTGSYEAEHGTVYTTDVVANSIQFLESKKESGVIGKNDSGYVMDPEPTAYQADIVSDEDLPF